ncbi:MAG TPA: PQQ-binding-like beta-propeller repeat protein, partial [Gemmataceae bacterium]|nr:PQQ-binding-like beta-propeller repeat protein [Gemmataceae bacterium]
QAKKWLDEGSATRDGTLLRRLADESFCSRFTEQALDLLGDLAFERGAFADAEHWWQMLARPASYAASPTAVRDLLVYPDPHLDIAQVRAKELLARLFLGELTSFQHELPAFQVKHGAASGHLAGRDGNYVDILQKLASQAAKGSRGQAGDAWRTFAGDPARNSVLPEASGRLSRIPQLDGAQWTVHLGTGEPVRDGGAAEGDAGLQEGTLAFYPLIVGERVLCADARYVSAYDLFTGKRVLHYDVLGDGRDEDANAKLKLEPPLRDLRDRMANREGVEQLSYTLTADADHVYARLGEVSIGARHSGEAASYLVCLNLSTGLGNIERWRIRPQSPERGYAVLEGAPVVHGGRVYIAVTYLVAVQTRTAIRCLNAESGATLWERDVCETQELKEGDKRFRHHLLTLAGGSIVYCSHSGAIVCLDADSGRRLWSVRYPSRGARTREGILSRRALAPCLFAANRLFVAPADYDRLLCLDPETGHTLWETAPLEVVHLLGVAGDKLYLNSVMTTGTGLSLQHNLRALDIVSGDSVWLKPDDGQTGLTTAGRGLLAGNKVYWPTSTGLIVLEQETGEVIASDRRIQGNLASADGCLIAAGIKHLTAHLRDE